MLSIGEGKQCCLCGKNVAASKRYRDGAGYWCDECHRWDMQRRRAARSGGPAPAVPPPPKRVLVRRGKWRTFWSELPVSERFLLVGVIVGILFGIGLVAYYLSQ
jgi:hypothetical protein